MPIKSKKDFLKKYNASKYDKPSVTTDVLVFTIEKEQLKILLIKRKNPPHKDMWAIPGGFVEIDEDLESSALRELKEETGIEKAEFIQLHTFGKPDRDPRTRVITVAYIALISFDQLKFKANSDAKEARLFPAYNLPKLAFDHKKIINYALKFIKHHILIPPLIHLNRSPLYLLKPFLPNKFTPRNLWRIYKIISNKKIGYDIFLDKITKAGLIKNDTKVKSKWR